MRFETFWRAYPKKKSKADAQKAFTKINPNEQLLAKMLTAIAWQRTQPDWTKDDGKFVPYPATWLNKQRWEDELHVATRPLGPVLHEKPRSIREIEEIERKRHAS